MDLKVKFSKEGGMKTDSSDQQLNVLDKPEQV